MHRPTHPLDDLFAADSTPFAPLYRRASFGKYTFKNGAALEAFADAQRALYEMLDRAGRKRQRELLIKLCDEGAYPQPQAPQSVKASLRDLLTPQEAAKTIDARTYRAFGNYLVQQEAVEDFIRAHEFLAQYEEKRVRALLAALRANQCGLRLLDNEEWNTAFIPAQDEETCSLIQWDRRMMLYDAGGAIVPSPLLLLHEEQHAVDFFNDSSGTLVLQATPSKEYGNHFEGGVIVGLEQAMLAAMGFPPRRSHSAMVVGALHLTATQMSLSAASGTEEPRRIGEHETIGRIIAIRNHEVLIRNEEGHITRYDARELSHFMSAGVDRAADGLPGTPKRMEKRIINTLRILHDAGLHKDTIKIAIRPNEPPTYHNPQQLLRQGETRSQPFQLPKSLGRSRTH